MQQCQKKLLKIIHTIPTLQSSYGEIVSFKFLAVNSSTTRTLGPGYSLYNEPNKSFKIPLKIKSSKRNKLK